MKIQYYSLPIMLACALGLAACGDDNEETTTQNQQQLEQPQTLEPLWKGVLLQREVSLNGSDGCTSPKRLAVLADGTFTAGPCTRTGTPATGTLTAAEETELNRLMNLLIEAENRATRECEQIAVLNESSIKVTLKSNTTYTAFAETEAAGRCYKGPSTNVDQLRAYLLKLEDKYYPSVAPSPSPSTSPSPSPSTSPSPSPSPSMSPSPSPSPTMTTTSRG